MGDIKIEVMETPDGLVAAPIGATGDTVTWIFTGNLVGRNLEVQPKGNPSASAFHKPRQSSEASRPPASVDQRVMALDYIVFDKDSNATLPWASGLNGGCVKFPDPPGN